MLTPAHVDYPVVAIGDLHGQRTELERLIERIDARSTWRDAALVFLGDLVDRGPDVCGGLELVIDLLSRSEGGSAVRGNHDQALVRAAQLDDGPPSEYWPPRYRDLYDCGATIQSYLGRRPDFRRGTASEFGDLKEAMPQDHRRFLADLPWVVEAPRHVFLHCGLSPELGATPARQVVALHGRRWERAEMNPIAGTATDLHWTAEYPVWFGADSSLSFDPRPHPSKVQVTGHRVTLEPDANDVRIRIDTSGGRGRLTACLLREPGIAPEFLFSR